MNAYRVGFIYTRCFLQKKIVMGDAIEIVPLARTGFAGSIHDGRRLLKLSKYQFPHTELNKALERFKHTGQSVLVSFDGVGVKTFQLAIESRFDEAEHVIGAVCVVSRNPAVTICAFAKGELPSRQT